MDFKNVIDSHRSQLRFYQALCIALVAVLGVLAVVVPASMRSGPYVIQEGEHTSSAMLSQPWRLSSARIEGFLRLFLASRFEWSKEIFDQRRDILRSLVSDTVFSKMKDSIAGYGSIAKSQNARGYYVLEGFRFSNERQVIEAQVSRIIRLGSTGVVTPLAIRVTYEDVSISDANPYGLRIKTLDEGEPGRVGATN